MSRGALWGWGVGGNEEVAPLRTTKMAGVAKAKAWCTKSRVSLSWKEKHY